MTTFEGKCPPTADKLRGGYYTPEPIAEFIAGWVAKAGANLLEPACGDGNILAFLAKHSGQTTGVEIMVDEALKAEARTGLSVAKADFFNWLREDRYGYFDGVAGNPPYIRFGNWNESSREAALSFMRSTGLKPNKLTNAWVPFVVASVVACKRGGRVGLVIPAEVLQVGYASELRQYLVDNCKTVAVVCFKQLVFPGILQEVVLLLAETGQGPARIQILEVADAAELKGLKIPRNPPSRALLRDREKWTKYFLNPEEIQLLRVLRADNRLSTVGDFCSVDVGVVTGRNSFFALTVDEARQRAIENLTIPLVSRSAQLTGLVYDDTDHLRFESSGGKSLLLDARDADVQNHRALEDYIKTGEAHDVHLGYKCRIRRKWWVVPSIWRADAFMLRQIHDHPRIVANRTGATSTDTVHRLRMLEGYDAFKLAAASFNSITFAMGEIVGRSYGGGVLELEPSEAEELSIPAPNLATQKIALQADQLVRAGKVEDALDLVDQELLVDRLGFSLEELKLAREAWRKLKSRRHRRSKAN